MKRTIYRVTFGAATCSHIVKYDKTWLQSDFNVSKSRTAWLKRGSTRVRILKITLLHVVVYTLVIININLQSNLIKNVAIRPFSDVKTDHIKCHNVAGPVFSYLSYQRKGTLWCTVCYVQLRSVIPLCIATLYHANMIRSVAFIL